MTRPPKPVTDDAVRPLRPGERVVLCIPHGGLNDTLCQIEKCWRYAENHSRTLVIDARRSSLFGEFSTIFSIKRRYADALPRLDAQSVQVLNRLACVPAAIAGRVDGYDVVYADSVANYVDTATGVQVTFDFDRDHSEPLLVHEQCGGGNLAIRALRRVALAPETCHSVRDKLARLPKRYVAIHVRNTDYRTDYEALFASIRGSVEGRSLLVCSDDSGVIAAARRYFERSDVLTVSEIPATDSPLHRSAIYANDEERRSAAIDAVTDLIALGGAAELHFANVTTGHPSGFSALANKLWADKAVIRALLDCGGTERGFLAWLRRGGARIAGLAGRGRSR